MPAKKKKGRETKYDSHIAPKLEKIRKWMLEGADIAEVAKKLKVAAATLKRYIALGKEGDERYERLYEIVCEATQENGEEVEAALFRLATGYNAKVIKHYKLRRVIYDPESGRKASEEEYLEEVEEDVHVAANVSAQMFWLTNRLPERWKHKPEGGEDDENSGTGVVELPSVVGFGQGEEITPQG